MQKRSDGAMKLAKEILYFAQLACDVKMRALTVEELATLIDRETGWILCSDRMPTRADASNTNGDCVRWYFPISGEDVSPWDMWQAPWPDTVKRPTHWQPCSTPPEESSPLCKCGYLISEHNAINPHCGSPTPKES